MSKTIYLLSTEEAQKIAAGEVVERPANILKELIENSLDAEAKRITVTLKNAGITLLEVSDDGQGMSEEDALLCCQRHTTSKIKKLEDLNNLSTFGFRGEALASICAVARVTLLTKKDSYLHATKLQYQNQKLEEQTVASRQRGTTITIEDLFYTIPARKKFLKTTATELHHCVTLFKAYALVYPSLHLTLIHDGQPLYDCPPVLTTQERVAQLYETVLSHDTLEVKTEEKNKIILDGAVTGLNYARYDKGGMFFFVNKRWIKNHQLAQAVLKAYANILPAGRFPFVALNCTLPSDEVDYNIHPKKEEVAFLYPQKIMAAFTESIKTHLEAYVSKTLKKTISLYTPETTKYGYPQRQFPLQQPTPPQRTPSFFVDTNPFPSEQPLSIEKKSQNEQQFIAVPEVYMSEPLSSYQYIGTLKKTYILLEHPEGLLYIDQHAAHERIMYEKFTEKFQTFPSITLMFPQIIPLTEDAMSILTPYFDLFTAYGVALEQLNPTTLTITAVPTFLNNNVLTKVIEELVAEIEKKSGLSSQELRSYLIEKLRAQMACKAAVKAGDILSEEQIIRLIKDLEKTKDCYTCPHGRPTLFLFKTYDLEKKFKRIL